jgi:PPP family 3-phenylpropionic acid transporter
LLWQQWGVHLFFGAGLAAVLAAMLLMVGGVTGSRD